MIRLGTLTKKLKSFAKNTKISDENFLNALLEPFISAASIKNRFGHEYHLDKSRSSRIINLEDDVPKRLREELERTGVEEGTEKNMPDFIEEYLDSCQEEHYKREVIHLIENDEDTRNRISNTCTVEKLTLSSLVTKMLLIAISVNNKAEPEKTVLWKRGAESADVLIGDLFKFGFENRSKRKNILVIPVNTAFDTHVTRKLENTRYPLVSENTLHGKWIIRMTKCNVKWDEIDMRIEESLRMLGFKAKSRRANSAGKKNLYPKGSIAIVETERAAFFLTAISEFNEQNSAGSCPEDIEHALDVLIDVYDKQGQGYDIYLPLMGTGRSRSGLSMQASYELITRKLNENQKRIHGRVHLVIRPDDKNEVTRRNET